MINSTKKLPIKQPKPNRQQLIKAAQSEWANKAEELLQEKENLGYKDVPFEEFLKMVPDDTLDTSAQSKLIDLQEQCKEHKELQKYLWAEDNVIAEFNKIHAVVHLDQTFILTEKINDQGDKDFSLESRQSFKAFYEDETIACIDGIERTKADIWLKSPKRRKYRGITFDPKNPACVNGYYNLWKGFAKKAIKGDCQKYWDHVRDNICNGDKESYIYLRKWLAFVFQHPHIVHTAIVVCGSQGVGKNSFVEPLGILFGSHYAPLSNIAELVSNFNYHLKNAVFIHANEALWGGHKKDIGTLKAMITDEYCLIEGKGKDRIRVKNFKHVILSSNEDWPVHLDADDRRFFALRVSEQCKENHAYFKAIQEELNNGGYEALLFDLLHEDLAGFNPRIFPFSPSSFDIKMRSADSPHRYLYEVLHEGGFSIGKSSEHELPVWQYEIPKSSVYEDYVAWCIKNGENNLSQELFGRVIKKVIMSIEDTRPSSKDKNRLRCYKLPTLTQAQEDFSKAFKEKPERIFDNYEDL